MGHEPLSPFLSFPKRMSRFLNLPQPSEVPESLADQFFGPKLASTEDRISVKGESGSRSSPTLPLDDSPKNDQNWTATNPQQPNSFVSPSSFSSNSQVLAKGSGSLGPWIGISQFILGLFLLSIDAIFNPISQSWFAVSASIFAILCAALSFVSASRWPDRISIWLLITCCLISSILWAFLCAECTHKLVNNSGMDCPRPMPKFGIGWLEQDGQEKLRPCLGPILHSLFICAALLGVFLSLCSLLLCANSLKPNQTNKRTPSSQPIVASARRPFSLLILPAGIRRPKPVHLPLIKMNGQVHRENITMENGNNRGIE